MSHAPPAGARGAHWPHTSGPTHSRLPHWAKLQQAAFWARLPGTKQPGPLRISRPKSAHSSHVIGDQLVMQVLNVDGAQLVSAGPGRWAALGGPGRAGPRPPRGTRGLAPGERDDQGSAARGRGAAPVEEVLEHGGRQVDGARRFVATFAAAQAGAVVRRVVLRP